jgi:hypothetical protein
VCCLAIAILAPLSAIHEVYCRAEMSSQCDGVVGCGGPLEQRRTDWREQVEGPVEACVRTISRAGVKLAAQFRRAEGSADIPDMAKDDTRAGASRTGGWCVRPPWQRLALAVESTGGRLRTDSSGNKGRASGRGEPHYGTGTGQDVGHSGSRAWSPDVSYPDNEASGALPRCDAGQSAVERCNFER